jgi:hypothetical protein
MSRETGEVLRGFFAPAQGGCVQRADGHGTSPAGSAGPASGRPSPGSVSLPPANPLTRVGTHQNAHQQPGAPVPQNQQPQNPVAPPTGWQPSVAAQAANPNDINGMLLRHAEALLNKGQTMPKRQHTACHPVCKSWPGTFHSLALVARPTRRRLCPTRQQRVGSSCSRSVPI